MNLTTIGAQPLAGSRYLAGRYFGASSRVGHLHCPGATKTQTGARRFYSVGPLVSGITESLQAVHSFSGLPWWAVIPLTTFALRAAWTLPLAVQQRKRIQKQSALRALVAASNPILKLNLGKRVQQAKVAMDRKLNDASVAAEEKAREMLNPLANMKYEQIVLLSAKEVRKRQKQLFKQNGVELWKNALLPLLQIPLWICMSLGMRDLSGWLSWDSLANTPLDTALHSEGLFWFQDLASYDHYHILPVVLGVVSLCNIEWTAKTIELARLVQRTNKRPTAVDSLMNVSRFSVVFMMAISLNAPAALVLYWISSQFFSLVQNMFLDLLYPAGYTPHKRLSNAVAKSPDAIDIKSAM